MSSGPVRTCVGCRRRAPQSELVRIVRGPGGRVALDPSGGAPGRGAYVCSVTKLKCFELAASRGRLGRALRAQVDAAGLEAIAEVLGAEASSIAEVLGAEASSIAEVLGAEASNEQKQELVV